MFTIEKRTSKNGNVYFGIFPNGGKRPVVVNDYKIISALTGFSYEALAEIRKNPFKPFYVRYDVIDNDATQPL